MQDITSEVILQEEREERYRQESADSRSSRCAAFWLDGGIKSTQDQDIKLARSIAKQWEG
jgi:hypothetical protein